MISEKMYFKIKLGITNKIKNAISKGGYYYCVNKNKNK